MAPPKIEQLIHDEIDIKHKTTSKKNPFEVATKKTTIKRSSNEIYPQRKGLNKPQIKSNKPIDILFEKLEKLLDLPYEDIIIDVLYNRLFQDNINDELKKRYKVIEQLLDYLLELQKYSIESYNNDKLMQEKNLITISLHDIKTFSKLINVIIVQGIYPVINTFQIGIPFEKRRLKEFTIKSVKITTLPKNLQFHQELLQLLYDKFFKLFSSKSDITDLLTKGTGYSDFLVISISLLTIPYFKFESNLKSKYHERFKIIEYIPQTFELFQTYSLLLSTPSPPYFKTFVMNRLQTLPYDAPKKDGVLSLIEFVLGLRDNEDINIEKFDHVANVILTKPSSVSTINYFTSIGNQFYDLLININRPNVTSCVGYVIEKLWNTNKLVTTDFILKRIWNNFKPENEDKDILVTEAQLNNNINVLISLTKKGLEPSLYKTVIEPIITSLWGYYLFCKKNSKGIEIISNLLTSYFTVMKDFDNDNISGLKIIANNLVTDGDDLWKFEIGLNNMVQIIKRKIEFENLTKEQKLNKYLNDLDFSVTSFIKLLENVDDELIQELFNRILKNWLENKKTLLDDENPFLKLIDLKLLEAIGEKFKDILAQTPDAMLEMVYNFLNSKKGIQTIQEGEDSDDEDEEIETLPVLLELLSAILSENDVIVDDKCSKLLVKLNKLLSNLINSSDLNQNVKKSIESLHSRIENIIHGDYPVFDELDVQKNQLARAITSLNDPLVPIRAHGLYLLRQLIESKSSIIALDFVINLHLVQLKDTEPFIYLNVIKGLEKLIEFDELQVLKILCNLYSNKDEDLDERLKIGEVLLRYITNSGELFTGELANLIVNTTIYIIRPENQMDNNLRMSSMSLLGTCCKVNPLGIVTNLETALDCAIGILNLETSKDEAIMRRSAIVLILDLILGTSESDKIEFPSTYKEKVIVRLKYIVETDNDLLTREQAQKVLDTINELVKLAMEMYND
ncbi:unnamed protein product [Candida verbasci]|uniref:RNA polymerase II assembly factor Rtp1 C-terminal domain-containing protein n=1 Tax=Candida verbasci TaxID=1227364 RepID=A0A9W4TZL5_9ASCO|nr:unnamed protein product [Candida verbasci]